TNGQPVAGQDTTLLSDTMAVQVSGLNGTTLYSIALRPVSDKDRIEWVSIGILEPRRSEVWLPMNARVAQVRSAITVSPHATFTITDKTGAAAPALEL